MSKIRSLLRWSAQLALTLAIQCASSSALVRGQCRVDLIGFPGDWTKINAAGDEVTLLPTMYKIWRLPGTGRDELLFGAVDRVDEELTVGYGGAKLKPEWFEAMPKMLSKSYSRNFFAVSIDGNRPRARKVSDAERLRAEPILNGYNYLSATDQKIVLNNKNSPSAVRYAGKRFARSGRAWSDTVGVLSPTGRWLAVLSYTGAERSKFSIFDEGGEPHNGVIHVDIYNPATGKKVLAGKHLFRYEPAAIFSASVWVEDRYLIIPLDMNYRTSLLLTLPARSACSSTVAPAGDRPEGRTTRAPGGWLMYTPSDKSFTVEVPATSHREVETYEGFDELTPAGWRPLHSYVAATLLETPSALFMRAYYISAFEVMSPGAESQKQIDELIDAFAGKNKRLTSSKQINIDGRRVREVTLASKDTEENEFVRVRFIETDARVYMLTYITNTSDIYSPSATRFFNSFRAKR